MSTDWPRTLLDRAVYPHPVEMLQLEETPPHWTLPATPLCTHAAEWPA